ncbi:MAG: hybrid sensor histidine kinase/response regulator [Pleurocapsa sp.]
MSSQLDPSILAAITAEARQCFLDEDAPEYLEMLESGFQNRDRPDFTLLLRAAHSLKGGAGLASLTSLQQLAHKLEDVLVGIQQEQIAELELAWTLVESSINEIAFVLSQARTVDEVTANPELIEALEVLAAATSTAEADTPAENNTQDNNLVSTTLTVNLETTLTAIEELDADIPSDLMRQFIAGFTDECLFIGETLNLPWLVDIVAPISSIPEEANASEILALTKEIIGNLRFQRDAYLQEPDSFSSSTETNAEENLIAKTLNQDLEESLAVIEELDTDTPPELIQQFLSNLGDECAFIGETLNLPWLVDVVAPIATFSTESEPETAVNFARELITKIRQQRDRYLAAPSEFSLVNTSERQENDEFETFEPETAQLSEISTTAAPKQSSKTVLSQLRIPLHKIEGMTNNIEELILTQSRLNRQKQLLDQANRRLRLLTKQFEPIRDQVQNLYNQLAIGSTNLTGHNSSSYINLNTISKNNSLDTTFDSLELDRYTELHTSLQSFQELMLQVQETRTDLDLINRELAEDLDTSQKNLDSLYTNVTESRLVPFQLLAKRFIPQIRNLNQRFDKSVNLEIKGEDTPIDQVLLEQLQTPLTHLLNNAFDHGIESKNERRINGKSETAQIVLQAKVENNQLIITIQDDGGGINLEKVYYRALERGICASDKSIKQFNPEEIIDWIFQPDFSTAAKVSDISGRGMGLDIVRSQITQLKGKIQVQTQSGLGTTFTIYLPLNLSLQSLLLIQLQNRIIAIPNSSVLESIPYNELNFIDEQKTTIKWQQKTIPVRTLSSLLPCPRQPLELSRAKVGIVIESGMGLLTILVDSLLREEKLIVKPFDNTVPVPAYIGGCTVLGSGEVIPIILPQGLESTTTQLPETPTTVSTSLSTIPTILVAEDSVATRRMLEKVLTAVGYQVLVCRDGQEALDQLQQHQETIDLILSDVEMPRVNGFELLEKVRAHPVFHSTPVVMATSRTGDRHREQAMKLGATDYLGKPIQPQELIDTVAALLGKS